jgi:subtilase family serine protease
MQRAVELVSTPGNPAFHQYLTPEQVGKRFGASPEDYQSLIDWASSHHLLGQPHPNHFSLLVTARAEDIEEALHVKLLYGERPDGTKFHAPDREPSLDLDTRLQDIDNLNDYAHPTAADTGSGSGPNGVVSAADIRTAYASCTGSLNGAGQIIGIGNPGNECYFPQDIITYFNISNLENDGGLPRITGDTSAACTVDAGGSTSQRANA